MIRRLLFGLLLALPFVFAQRAATTSPTSKFIILPAIIAGLVIGLYEAISLIKDVQVGTGKIGHAVHSLIWALAATFLSFNVAFALSLVPQLGSIPILGSAIAIRIILGLLTAIKVHAISRVTKSGAGISGLSETWFHTFFVGALVGAAPYIWMALNPVLPALLKIA